jgi:hypothetical protein
VETKKDCQIFALNFYKRSAIESMELPLDKDFVIKNFQNISQHEYEEILIYYINSFPNIFTARFMLLTICDYLIHLDLLGWVKLHQSLSNVAAANTLVSFYRSYLCLMPNSEVLTVSPVFSDYIYENDDVDFIENNHLENDIKMLRKKMLSLGFISENG